MPRFTTAPSGMSEAMRRASSSRLMRVAMSVASLAGRRGGRGLEGRPLDGHAADELTVTKPRSLAQRHHAVDVDAGRHDGLGVDAAERHDVVDLHDRRRRRGRHERPEVAGSLTVDEVAPTVGREGAHEGVVGTDGVLQHVVASVDAPRLAPLGELGAVSGGRVEGADAGPGGADAFGQVALRHELELDLTRPIQTVEYPGVALPREGA